MMCKKTKLAALALCFALLVCALTGVACGTTTDSGSGDSGDKVEWSFSADVPVACEENEKVSIILSVEGAEDYETVYEVTFGEQKVEVSENGEFTPTGVGEYTVKVKVTYNGETKEKTFTLTVIKDATAPVITTPIANKTAEKGDYDFTNDLAAIVATDNKTQAENIKKSIVSVTLDGAALEITENVCTFERAGEYNVTYKVEDEESNAVTATYTVTVSGLYVNEKTFVGEIFQLSEYEIAAVNSYGYENATVKVTLTQDEKSSEVSQGDIVKFLSTSEVTIKYALSVGEEEKDSVVKTVSVKALDMLLSQTDFAVTEGEEVIIPTATLSHETAGVTITAKIVGQYQEEQAVAQGDKISAARGVTRIIFTAENEDKSFSLEREASVVAIGKDEIVSFERINGDNPDFNVPQWGQRLGNEELNSDPAYVHSGKYSAKLIFGPKRPNANVYSAGFCYWANQIRNADVEGANGISMWVYCPDKEAYIVPCIATGVGDGVYSGARASHVVHITKGWNEININFDYQIYDSGKKTAADGTVLGALDIKNGISELFFHRVKRSAVATLESNGGDVNAVVYEKALTIYLDEVRVRKLELPEGVYFTFDKKPESTGVVGGVAVAVAPRMLVTEGVTLTVTVTAPDETQQTVNAGDSFDLTLGGYYTITYKAEKEGKPSQEVSYQILVTDPGEFLSFETINGATPDLVGDIYGSLTVNTDTAYVKTGSQSAKLTIGTNNGGTHQAGFAHWNDSRHMPNIEGANGITFWMHSDVETYLYTYISTGTTTESNYTGLKATKPVALKVGWNRVAIDMRYDMAQSGANISNGICELVFRLGNDINGEDTNGGVNAILYLDSVCFAVLPDRVIENLAIDYMNINLPDDQTSVGDREFGMVTRCTDEAYTKNGKPSLKLEMFAHEEPLKKMRACYSAWGKGIMLTGGENAVKFEVYSSRDAFVSFEFGTGGNVGSGGYSGAKFSKVITLNQGWNTVTLTFGSDGDVVDAILADGIVHFGATTVNSSEAKPENGCFPDVATEELTLYVSTMYAIVA